MDYNKYLNKSKEKFNELDQIKKDAESMESTMMKPKMKHIDSEVQDSTQNLDNEDEDLELEQNLKDNNESKSTLEIFELGFHFARLLGGEKEAIADLEALYKRHEKDNMFNDLGDVRYVIKQAIENPEIIIDANKDNEPYTIIKALTRLNSRKMGDIIIKNQDNLNEIFHANKKKMSEFTRVAKKLKPGDNLMIDGGDTQSPRPDENQVRVAGTESVRSSTNETITDNTLNKAESESTHTRRKP